MQMIKFLKRYFKGDCDHKWLAWKDIREGNITRCGIVKGFAVEQESRCEICNKLKLRIAKVKI
jgi:hypothetical protein